MFNPAHPTSTATATAGSASCKAGRPNRFHILAFQYERFVAVMSGMGLHRSTGDSDLGRRSAQRHVPALRAQHPQQTFRIEPTT